MISGVYLLSANAAALAFLHTIAGPDHYLPFVALGRTRGWKLGRTIGVTLACGVAHVVSSATIALVGVAAGLGLDRVMQFETTRGTLAAWGLIVFGALYAAWGMRRTGRRALHIHVNREPAVSNASHHPHACSGAAFLAGEGRSLPWVLFIVLAFGPCESLIPILMYPAALQDWSGAAIVIATFGAVTLATMGTAVMLLSAGIRRVRIAWIEPYAHALAGFSILTTGLALQMLGL